MRNLVNARSIILLFTVLFWAVFVGYSQNQPGTELHIKKAMGTITLDGVLDESDWQSADVADDWYMNYPVDTVRAPFQTEARFTFNDEFFYASFVCYDDDTPDIVNSLRRDFNYDLNDNVGFAIGPYNDKLNGFFFVITPAGVQMEGTVTGGGTGGDSFSTFWDNKWYSKVVRYKDKWIAELAIPFKSLRYRSDVSEWNISMDRWELKRNQKTSWIQTPIQFISASFPYGGQLIWDDPIPPSKTNISFIPYITANTSADREVDPVEQNSGFQAGFDAKIAVTPSLNLDLTVNPDFSQVEVDDQIINLTRFEFQFPERRQFFLENSDLFDLAGFPGARPFFSRRIGLAADSSGLFQQVPIAYGARLSGSLNEKWRVNVLNMQTREETSIGLPAQNYTVAALQRNFWAQSNLTLSFVNKQSFGVGAADSTKFFSENVFREVQLGDRSELRPNTYNRVVSLDLEMSSKDTKWYHSSFIAKSFDDFNSQENLSGLAFGRYQTRTFSAFTGFSFINQFFNAEAGFVPSIRVYPGQYTLFGNLAYQIFPDNESIIRMGPSFDFSHTYIPGGTNTDRSYELGYRFEFLNASSLGISFNHVFQRLTNDFSLLDPDGFTSFLEGEEYDWNAFSISYRSNPRKKFFYQVNSSYGGFYNGENFNLSGEIAYRYQPYGNIALRFDFNDLRLPENYGQEQLFLIGPRIDLTFTDEIFLTTYVQYNNVLDNVNLNARLQWRYQPASDLFIVYTENYLPQDFGSKNRALVLKMTYWLNL
ncbi:MAG: DUF5916 domain-containing protein [Bacteroidota bacterium]